MKSDRESKKRFYLRWPYNLAVYIGLAISLRIFSIPLILLIMAWNRKQQPDGPEEGYCLQRTRGQLILLVWAGLALLFGAAAAVYLVACVTESRYAFEQMELTDYLVLGLAGVVAVAGVVLAVYLARLGLRDAFFPEKSHLAQSIREQLDRPDDAIPVGELFSMVDDDLEANGRWFGKLGVGQDWVLGDEAMKISRIRGIFGQDEIHTSHGGGRVRRTRILRVWLLDDRQRRLTADLPSRKDLDDAMEYLHQRVPAAVTGSYGSKEYDEWAYADDDAWQLKDLEFRRRMAQMEQSARQR